MINLKQFLLLGILSVSELGQWDQCTDGWIHEWTYGSSNGWTDGWTYRWANGWTDGVTDGCIDE